ncbi:MAG: hypothetical protein AM1032_000400 [Mycoplasmataceae bacterium]|nr:MAG: hypothetical protein AM1032_000400 [Mycoplasmataceae bacterium]
MQKENLLLSKDEAFDRIKEWVEDMEISGISHVITHDEHGISTELL